MARDEALLHAAGAGRASLRFYGWREATLSLGYFQQSSSRTADNLLASLPWVRRPTGGATLVHHHELTYALAVPLSAGERKPHSWMVDMHRIIGLALERLGLQGRFQAALATSSSPETSLCFEQPTAGDLLHGRHKLLGSSQRKHRHALLQHGALLLAQSPFTPMLPGIKELTGVELGVHEVAAGIIRTFAEVTGFAVEPAGWLNAEERLIAELAETKYGRPEWNEKR